jgi:hypothetical protein
MNAKLYDDKKEQSMHLDAITSFARQSGIPEEEIRRIYEMEFEKLKAAARVKDFLLPLTDGIVRDIIRHLKGHLH